MIDTGSTAWVLASAALVMFMTPGLALFYGGMVRSTSVLNVMVLTFVCLAAVGVVWVLYGYSLSFGPDWFGGLLGNLRLAGMRNLASATVGPPGRRIPLFAFAAFQLMFAVITVALLVGAIAERTRFWTWLVFSVVWVSLVYLPVAHWVFSSGGWIAARLHALDFAGGTVVEVNSGAAALALAVVLGRRHGWPQQAMRPHNLPFVMFGAGLLWFGWFGFNAGSALGANGLLYGGGFGQLWRQAVATGAVLVYSLLVTALIGWALHRVMGFRVHREAEVDGIDEAEHAEGAYDLGPHFGRRLGASAGQLGAHHGMERDVR